MHAQLKDTAPASLEDVQRHRIFERVQREFEAAKASGHRFAYIGATYDEDFAVFIEAITVAANNSSPPPHAMAPYYGESRGRNAHSTKISGGVIITF